MPAIVEEVRIAVVGLGYVGLPTALSLHDAGFKVLGVDNSHRVIQSLRNGVCHLRDDSIEWEIPPESEHWSLHSDYETAIPRCDVVLITVPTPVYENKKPDLSYVRQACEGVVKNLNENSRSLVVLQSTVYPGVTRKILGECCQSFGKSIGEDLMIAYSPERVDPGDTARSVSGVSQIIGCDDKDTGEWLAWMFGQITDQGAYYVGKIEVAEASKLIENVQRDIDIAFTNELSITLPMMGLDVEEVLNAAATKWNFHRHKPGIGVGGHCIPVDPYYYIDITHNIGFPSRISEAARTMNTIMPSHSVEMIESLFKEGLEGKKILILGYSYKPNVGDSRETPVKHLCKSLEGKGSKLYVFDPLVQENDIPPCAKKIEAPPDCKSPDLVVLATQHKIFDASEEVFWEEIRTGMEKPIIFDGRRGLSKMDFEARGWEYHGIGLPVV